MCKIDYQYLLPKKAAALQRLHEEPFPMVETPPVWVGKNATVLPVRKFDPNGWFGRGGVIAEDGTAVESCAVSTTKVGYEFENPQYRDEKVVYCGYLIHHWGHFLMEGVARLWYFLEQDPTVDRYVFSLDENEQREIRGNYLEFLKLLGIWDKLDLITTPTRFREVIVPEQSFRPGKYWSPKFLDIFETIAGNVKVDPSWEKCDRMFFSRSQLKKGNALEFGFDTFDSFFEKNGYKVVFPEKLSLSQMIYMIRGAQAVSSISGSSLHNMLFARPGQTLEILERCVFNNDWQVYVNLMCRLNVIYIDANISLYPVPMGGPFIMGYNEPMQRFAADRGMAPPDPEYCTEQFRKECFLKYMNAYRDLYRYKWFEEGYLMTEMDYHIEGYRAGHAYFADYLDGKRPFRWHHYLEIHYWKQYIKRRLKSMGILH